MARYRSRSVEVDAVRFTGYNLGELAQGLGLESGRERSVSDPMIVVGEAFAAEDFVPQFVIETVEGDVIVWVGDWVIKGAAGDFDRCRSDVFEQTYEEVEP